MLGEIIAAGASLAGGLFGKSAADKQAKLQKQFAKNGIQWKVEDAKKAGIHPLYALGANTISYQPSSVGGGLESALPQMGQDIGRAIDQNQRQGSKASTLLGTALVQAQIEGVKLDNDIKRAQLASDIAKMGATLTRPGLQDPMMPPRLIDGQGDAQMVDPKAGLKIQKQVSPSSPYDATGATEGGVTPDVQFVKTKTGWAPAIPQPLQEAMEDDWIGKAQWNLRNRVYPFMPDIGKYKNPFYNVPFPPPKGMHWVFNAVIGEYQLRSD